MIDPKAQLDVSAIASLISLFIPLFVAFVTTRYASSRLHSLVSVASSAVTSVLAIWISQPATHVTYQLIVNTFVISLVTSVASYKGVWKPLGATDAVKNATPNFGLGTTEPVAISASVTTTPGLLKGDPLVEQNWDAIPDYNPGTAGIDPDTMGAEDHA